MKTDKVEEQSSKYSSTSDSLWLKNNSTKINTLLQSDDRSSTDSRADDSANKLIE